MLLPLAAVGMAWGLACYAVLWGHTWIVVHRSFVVSPVGTLILLPMRLVLWGIRAFERASGGPFDFSSNNWWIGVAAGLVGAVIVTLAVVLVRQAVRVVRGSGRQSVPETTEGV